MITKLSSLVRAVLGFLKVMHNLFAFQIHCSSFDIDEGSRGFEQRHLQKDNGF